MIARNELQVGDSVEDLTAIRNEWPDQKGKVIAIDAGHVLVEYDESGARRVKLHSNLRLKGAT